MSDSEDPIESPIDGGDDLFGDGDDDAPLSDNDQPLSDHGLDSDREEAAPYGGEDDEGEERQVKTKLIMGVHMFRHRVPKPKDGNLRSLRVPQFMSWNPQEYNSKTYEPSKFDLENSADKNTKPIARFRKGPKQDELQSNTTIYRWSDGSVTLAVGEEHYEMQSKALVPPSNKPYQELQDAHYYAAAAHLSSNSLLVVGHVTEQFDVRPNRAVEDDALKRLTNQLAAASRGGGAGDGDMIMRTTQDPELQKRQAEMAEKERERARRKRENAAARLDGVGRFGGRGALSVGDLEGRRGPGGRKRGMPGAPRQKRRRPEYDSDDDLPEGGRRQEEYDLEDGFIVASDEDISVGEEDEEDILDDYDDDEDEAPRKKRQKTADAEDEDADAEADMDDDLPQSKAQADSSRRAHRRVVDDDDE